MYILQTDSADGGHSGSRRERVYVILAHKQRTELLQDPVRLYESVTNVIRENITTTPKDYLVSGRVDVLRAAQRLALKRKIRFRSAPCQELGVILLFEHDKYD